MNPRITLAAVAAAGALAALPWLPWTATEAQAQAAKPVPVAQDYQVGDRLAPRGAAAKSAYPEIEWDDLLPADWNPQALFEEVDLDSLSDADPRAIDLLRRLREEWDRAPVVQAMDGRRVRIPGFVVPLEGDGKTIREFLLVPYFGACIHVPPPPANQLIHVQPAKAIPGEWNMVPVWVNGELSVERVDSELGNAGYRLRAVSVEEYVDTEPLPD
ncbi:DUF3299 domain-containing protein [Pseudothauera nasutitermitis]|uniref:DUF3299 domain-containing protein n=1 Tax=Pseudothauera nasutitermitis TaxID=2565930 RepID=A0A4S4AWP0_9RHOO|nr:DUF3299 domain-containing protein [Pseudothauera nasutitermitis]THF63028.1 DUF3299 domain-containing protein [Pseudothauera nasutitermitis]